MEREFVQVFIAIVKLALEIAIHYWPISALLSALAIAALIVGSPMRNSSFRRRLGLAAFVYLIPFLVPVLGALLRYDVPPELSYRSPPSSYGLALWVPPAIYLVCMLTFFALWKSARLRSIAILAPGMWLLLCATLPAGFAIAGMAP